jgi:hypothetical protein
MKFNFRYNLNLIFFLLSLYLIYHLLNGLFIDIIDKIKTSTLSSGSKIITSSIIILTSLLYFLNFKLKKYNFILIFFFGLIFLTLITNTFFQLLLILFLLFSSAILGSNIKYILKIKLDDDLLTNTLLGLGILSFIFYISVHFKINYSWLYYSFLFLIIFINLKYSYRLFNNIKNYTHHLVQQKLSNPLLLSLILSLFIIYFILSLVPITSGDAQAYHLYVPNYIKHNLFWHFDFQSYVFALFPNTAAWINSIVLILGGNEFGLNFLVTIYIIFICLIIRKILLFYQTSYENICYVIIIFLSTPLTFSLNISLQLEVLWSLLFLTSFYYLILATKKNDNCHSLILLSALFYSFAVSTKQQALLASPIYLMYLLYNSNFFKKNATILLTKIFFIFLILGLSSYLEAWYLTGNPIFPFYNVIFESPFYPLQNFSLSEKKIYQGVVYAFGFSWLALLPLILLIYLFNLRNNNYSFILLSAIITLCSIFYFSGFVRYVFPSFILFLIFFGLTLHKKNLITLNSLNHKIFTSLTALTIILNILFITFYEFTGSGFSYKHIINTEKFNEKYASTKYLAAKINQLNVFDENVIFFSGELASVLNAKAVYVNWYNEAIKDKISLTKNHHDLLKIFKEYRIKFLVIDKESEKYLDKKNFIDVLVEPVFLHPYIPIGIYKLKEEYEWSLQLLKNPNFEENTGWSKFSEKNFLDNKSNIKIVNPNIIQKIKIDPNEIFKNTLLSKCLEKQTFGMHLIYWFDSKNKLLEQSYKSFTCTEDWEEQSMIGKVPKRAAYALVYTTSASDVPILVKSNSLFIK